MLKSLMPIVYNYIRYGSPMPLGEKVELTPYFQEKLIEFKRDGITAIYTDELAAVADYINEFYISRAEQEPYKDFYGLSHELSSGLFIKSGLKKNAQDKLGITAKSFVSLKDRKIHPMILNPQIIGLISKYMGRQAIIRNSPMIECLNVTDGETSDNFNYHVDHFHQVSIQLLLDDVTEDQTHLRYRVGSHRRSLLKTGLEPSYQSIAQEHLDQYKTVRQGVGPKGTLVIFNAFGYHRGYYLNGSKRKTIFLNFTSGHNLYEFAEPMSFLDDPYFMNQPQIIRRALRHDLSKPQQALMSKSVMEIGYKVDAERYHQGRDSRH